MWFIKLKGGRGGAPKAFGRQKAVPDIASVQHCSQDVLPNRVLGSMGGGYLGESNLKKLLVTV